MTDIVYDPVDVVLSQSVLLRLESLQGVIREKEKYITALTQNITALTQRNYHLVGFSTYQGQQIMDLQDKVRELSLENEALRARCESLVILDAPETSENLGLKSLDGLEALEAPEASLALESLDSLEALEVPEASLALESLEVLETSEVSEPDVDSASLALESLKGIETLEVPEADTGVHCFSELESEATDRQLAAPVPDFFQWKAFMETSHTIQHVLKDCLEWRRVLALVYNTFSELDAIETEKLECVCEIDSFRKHYEKLRRDAENRKAAEERRLKTEERKHLRKEAEERKQAERKRILDEARLMRQAERRKAVEERIATAQARKQLKREAEKRRISEEQRPIITASLVVPPLTQSPALDSGLSMKRLHVMAQVEAARKKQNEEKSLLREQMTELQTLSEFLTAKIFSKSNKPEFVFRNKDTHSLPMLVGWYLQERLGFNSFLLEKENEEFRLICPVPSYVLGQEFEIVSRYTNLETIVTWLDQQKFADECDRVFGYDSLEDKGDLGMAASITHGIFLSILKNPVFQKLQLRNLPHVDCFDLSIYAITPIGKRNYVKCSTIQLVLWFLMGKIHVLAGEPAGGV
jgi:hypothetical protein